MSAVFAWSSLFIRQIFQLGLHWDITVVFELLREKIVMYIVLVLVAQFEFRIGGGKHNWDWKKDGCAERTYEVF
jgi:hypothetical protein